MTERLPELWKAPPELARQVVDGPRDWQEVEPEDPQERRRHARNAFRDFLGNLVDADDLPPVIEAWEIRYAATGIVTCIAAVLVGTILPATGEVEDGFFEIGLFQQQITVGRELLTWLVQTWHTLLVPVLAIAIPIFLFDAYLAVRPRQPLVWHYFCALQMLAGLLAGAGTVAILLVALANVALGLLAAAVALVFIVVILGLALAFLSAVSD